ncbi:MAG: hypothetical protein K5979_08290 [Ruminococcus sp.]|nr:hypothetical protein [Ruminococcus sp.]
MMSPCKDCTDRCIGCHSTCGDYKLYRAEIEKRNAEKAEKNAEKDFIYAVKDEVFKRFRKRQKGDDR